MIGQDLYIKTSRGTLGGNVKSHITQHRVWDAGLFMQERIKSEAQEAAKDGRRSDSLTVVTRDEYLAQIAKK